MLIIIFTAEKSDLINQSINLHPHPPLLERKREMGVVGEESEIKGEEGDEGRGQRKRERVGEGEREGRGALAVEKLFCKLDTTSLMPVKSSAADDCSH